MWSVCEQQLLSYSTDSQMDLVLNFDWAILTQEYALIGAIVALAICLVVVLLKGEHPVHFLSVSLPQFSVFWANPTKLFVCSEEKHSHNVVSCMSAKRFNFAFVPPRAPVCNVPYITQMPLLKRAFSFPLVQICFHFTVFHFFVLR